jgi:hypothetical protein
MLKENDRLGLLVEESIDNEVAVSCLLEELQQFVQLFHVSGAPVELVEVL